MPYAIDAGAVHDRNVLQARPERAVARRSDDCGARELKRGTQVRRRPPGRTPFYRGVCLLILWVTAACGCLLGAGRVQSAEPCRAFLEALREQRYFDSGLYYLEQMRESPLASAEFKELIDYEKGALWIAQSKGLPAAQRGAMLDKAQESLEAFLKAHAQHPLVAGAQSQLAEVMVERGRIKREQALRSNRLAAEKESLLTEARTLYQSAQQAFEDAQKQFAEAEKKLGKVDPGNTRAVEQQDALRHALLHTRLAVPGLQYELAQTYEGDSPQRKEQLEAAIKGFEKVFDQYKPLPAAYYAKLGEARCWSDLGDGKKAIATLQPVARMQDSREVFRTIRAKALIVTLEVCLQPNVKDYKEATALSQAWLSTARSGEQQNEDGLAIKYLSGLAWLETARGAKGEAKDQAVDHARRLFTSVARYKSEHQQAARSRLADAVLGGKGAAKEPATFPEALDRGQTALDRLVALNEEAKKAAENKLPKKNQAEIVDARDEAFRYFQLALQLAAKTPLLDLMDLNRVRYCLAYLYWESNRSWESAVLGEFVARRYPDHPEALQAAKIALASYLRLYTLIPANQDRKFALDHMQSIAKLIAKRWPKQPVVEEAWLTLIRSALQAGESDQAMEYLKYIDPDSPHRVEANLMAGQALWVKYAKARQLPAESRPKPEELDALIAQSEEKLKAAVSAMKEAADGKADAGLVAAILALTQVTLIQQRPTDAVQLLEDSKYGPLTLMNREDAAATEGNLPAEICKVALQAYVGTQQLDKAEQLMTAMEKSVDKDDPESGNRLAQIYLRLGQELQSQLKSLREAKKIKEVTELSRGLDRFLTQIAAHNQKAGFGTMGWVAETFRSLAEGLDPGSGKLPADTQAYYERAVKAYQELLARCEKEPNFAPNPEIVLTFRVRMSFCLRRLGKYKETLDLLGDVLKAGTNVPAQIEAAYTYQAWGDEKPGFYELAILGGRPQKLPNGTETRLFWGWAKIAKMVQQYVNQNPRYKEVFFEARYNIPLCRLKWQAALSGTQKANALKDAERDILVLQMLYPDMGGPEWFPKFDALLKKIQQLQERKPVGLQQKAPAPSAPSQPATANPR